MNEQQEGALRAGLAALAATSRDASASAHVERAVLQAMQPQQPAASARVSLRWLPLAAALLIATASGAWLARHARPMPPAAPSTLETSGFLEIPGAAGLPPFESGAIVRVALPVTSLPSYGIQIQPDFGTAPVLADVLVAQDGYPRAIRLVGDSDSSRSTP